MCFKSAHKACDINEFVRAFTAHGLTTNIQILEDEFEYCGFSYSDLKALSELNTRVRIRRGLKRW